MNDEIKEILELFGSTDENIMFCDIVKLNSKQSHLLLDYITNLQQDYERIYNENCKLREEHNITDISLLDKNYKLQQENERLKEIINDDMTVYLKGLEDGKEKMKQCFESIYKSRCEKAIEYIEKHSNSFSVLDTISNSDLLNILQNGSDNQ